MATIVGNPARRARIAAMLLTALTLGVVMLGAYVRLSDAGLSCPDWPGCYGAFVVPADEVAGAHPLAEVRPLDAAKAWKEMVHRYLASTLGLGIVLLALWSLRRYGLRGSILPLAMVLLVGMQGLLGMWTVTLQVKPAIVTLHLLGGLSVAALLWWYGLRAGKAVHVSWRVRQLRGAVWLALALLTGQIALGGWTSANYAALGCTEFPTCLGGRWWPEMDFSEAFVLWRGTGVNYEFGILDAVARTAIHITHRIGALLVLLVAGAVAVALSRQVYNERLKRIGWLLGGLLALQIGLGIHNVIGGLPLINAVAHNGSALLLLLTLVTALHHVTPGRDRAH